MKWLIVSLLLVVAPLGYEIFAGLPGNFTQKIAIQYGQKRPFSFYYPYNYKFYYPRPQYHPSSYACYWLYTNGTYVYYCK